MQESSRYNLIMVFVITFMPLLVVGCESKNNDDDMDNSNIDGTYFGRMSASERIKNHSDQGRDYTEDVEIRVDNVGDQKLKIELNSDHLNDTLPLIGQMKEKTGKISFESFENKLEKKSDKSVNLSGSIDQETLKLKGKFESYKKSFSFHTTSNKAVSLGHREQLPKWLARISHQSTKNEPADRV